MGPLYVQCVYGTCMHSLPLTPLWRKDALGIMLSNLSQIEKDKCFMISLMSVEEKQKTGVGVVKRAIWNGAGRPPGSWANRAPTCEINFLHFWNGYILIQLLELGLHHWTLLKRSSSPGNSHEHWQMRSARRHQSERLVLSFWKLHFCLYKLGLLLSPSEHSWSFYPICVSWICNSLQDPQIKFLFAV